MIVYTLLKLNNKVNQESDWIKVGKTQSFKMD